MASHKSALKKHRQDLKRRDRNRGHRSRLRTVVKKTRQAAAAGDASSAEAALPGTLSLVDRSAKHGVIHARKAARLKPRSARAVHRAKAPGKEA